MTFLTGRPESAGLTDKLLAGQQRAVPTRGNLRPRSCAWYQAGAAPRVDCPSGSVRAAFASALAPGGAA